LGTNHNQDHNNLWLDKFSGTYSFNLQFIKFLIEPPSVLAIFAIFRSAKNGGEGGIPGFALEPKFALMQISIGALPLWRHFAPVTPTTWENPFPTPFEGSNPAYPK